jgi:hypothetical protein
MQVYAKQYINVKLKFRMNKNYYEKRKAYWYISCLDHFKQRPIDVTTFRLSKSLISRSVPFKRINNFGFIFTNHKDRGTYETKLPTHVSFFFPTCRITLIFPSTLKTFLLFLTIAMLSSLYQSLVNCWSRDVERN